MTDSTQATGNKFRCGFVTIVGRPNVGKSTLLNSILGQKISITSRKPQTTRRHLLGIKTGKDYQALFVDTPGLQDKHRDSLNRYMSREVKNQIADCDLILFMIEAGKWLEEDDLILRLLNDTQKPVMLVINKIDKISTKKELLPLIKAVKNKYSFMDIIPISARKNENLESLEKAVVKILPYNPPQFPDDDVSDQNERYFAAEFVREKLVRKLGEELPYKLAVTIERYEEKGGVTHINAVVWVESNNQKSIVIGKNGALLKAVGEKARKDIENLIDGKVNLKTWVKVKKKWTNDINALNKLGYSIKS